MRDITDNPSIEADVVIVGAGFAGITAAREISRAGKTVAVLEARSRIGGRSLSHPIGDGKIVEFGCEHIGRRGAVADEMADAVGISSYKQYDRGYKLTDQHDKLVRWKGQIPRANPITLADYFQAAMRLERMRREVPEETPWDAPHARRWDSETLSSWMRRNMLTRGGRTLMSLLTEAGFAAPATEISLLHILNYSNGLGGYRAVTKVTGGSLERRLVGGSQGLVHRLAENIEEQIFLGAVVRRIEQFRDRVRLTGPGFDAVGRRVVITVPVPLAARIEYLPALPGYRDQLTQRLPAGSVIKYLSVYDEPFWRKEELSGTALSHVGPVQAVMDGSPPDGSPGVLTAFVTGPNARKLARLPGAARRDAVVGALTRIFGPRAGRPFELFEKDWMAEEYTRGCYHGCTPPGLLTEYGAALRNPIGRIHWAGSETVPIEYGSMSGAIDSGRRVATEILDLEAYSQMNGRTV
ncbi:flavin monoamine oxidase family protein [Antrihabitans cavernicola]|uniref:FAD-dependent oxidoreductase n=1 Tax=Antrihabitans cavernicola TaxID=2495913 RepID=A0A5A7S4W0_9NOCA|nr:FAD-dependent oxidoreductase [Spelaeibacter cavernicola]KAA0017028.1 FAD-dependent oxidoreductase [Spelaeibacter cavernicola]